MAHKGLKRYYESGSLKGIKAAHKQKLRIRLSALDTASSVEDMDLPGFHLHPLTGDRKGLWAIDVSGNWRIVFKFENGNAYVVNYEDYH